MLDLSVQVPNSTKKGPLKVKPFFNPQKENMGLEKYGMVLFDTVAQEEGIACIERNGIRHYVTGLNEFAPEIKLMDEENRSAKIKHIRTIISQLERELAANVIDPEDNDFWAKVKVLRPDNYPFWDKISIRLTNEGVTLDPIKDPIDLIKLYAIEAGGFSMIAKSYEDAKSSRVLVKFYLDKKEDTMATVTESKKIKNKALAELQKLFDKGDKKLFYIAKVIDFNSVQYKNSTPKDVIYDNLDSYINGNSFEKVIKKAAQRFIDISRMDMETLKLTSLVKDASFYKFIATKPDGYIYHTSSTSLLGKNQAEVVEYLKNPLNESILVDVMKKVEKYWNE